MKRASLLFFAILCLIPVAACAPLTKSGEAVPVSAPATVSQQLKTAIDAGFPDWWKTQPKTAAEWKNFQQSRAEEAVKSLPALYKAFDVKSVKGEIARVPVFTLEPDILPQKNKDRILLHLHGGGYVLNQGEAAIPEGVLMAGIGKYKVISVDYRMAPEFPYPAALDDAMKVYKALLKTYPASHIGVFGTSTGGGMALALVLKAKQERLPLPGAIAPGTPWSDLTDSGDSYRVNEKVDNVLVAYDGWLKAAAKAYAAGHEMKDPLISPVYGDVSGFPPHPFGHGHTRPFFKQHSADAPKTA